MKEIPDNAKSYKSTKIFDENNIPNGIRNDHQTMDNVWGKINVIEGELLYTIQSNPFEEIKLNPTIFGVIEPGIKHKVTPTGKVKFYVEFYK